MVTSNGDGAFGERRDALGVFSREGSSVVMMAVRVSKEGGREEYGE